MSFSVVGANPSWGTAMTAAVGYPYGFPDGTIGVDSSMMEQVNLGPVLACAAIDKSGLNTPIGGWQLSFVDPGGGGGSERPVSGLVYPRLVG